MFLFVALAAVVASGVVVVGVLATRNTVPPAAKPRAGLPPLALDFGVRTDREAVALRQAQGLYDRKEAGAAAAIFGRYRSVDAQIGSAFAGWPAGTLSRLESLAAAHPRSSAVALHLGLALYWARHDAEALDAWRNAHELQPDTPYAVRASDFLHPQFAPGQPVFVPSFPMPLSTRVLAPPQQLAALERAAGRDDAHAKILYGVALQKLGRQQSAEHEFVAAVHFAPRDPDARVAAIVGRFDKGDPSAAFSRLGPLVRVFPHSQSVRFHLGLLLLWMAQVKQARIELQKARAEAPGTVLGHEATRYLAALRGVGTR